MAAVEPLYVQPRNTAVRLIVQLLFCAIDYVASHHSADHTRFDCLIGRLAAELYEGCWRSYCNTLTAEIKRLWALSQLAVSKECVWPKGL